MQANDVRVQDLVQLLKNKTAVLVPEEGVIDSRFNPDCVQELTQPPAGVAATNDAGDFAFQLQPVVDRQGEQAAQRVFGNRPGVATLRVKHGDAAGPQALQVDVVCARGRARHAPRARTGQQFLVDAGHGPDHQAIRFSHRCRR